MSKEINSEIEHRVLLADSKKYLEDIRAGLEFESSSAELDISKLDTSLSPQRVTDINSKIQLMVGKQFVYISRRDISDPSFNGGYNIPLQVARLALNEMGEIEGITINNEKFLSNTFKILEQSKYFENIKRRFNIANESEQEAQKIAGEVESLNAKAAEQQKNVQIIIELGKMSNPYRESLDIQDNAEVVNVSQGEIGFIDANDNRRYIETIGAGPCIIVVGYNPQSKSVGLTHMDAMTEIPSTITELIQRTSAKEISILGGDMSSVNELINLKGFFEKNNIPIKEWDILNVLKNIIVDKETGRIFNVSKPKTRGASTISPEDLFRRSLTGKQKAKIV